ncbi:transposase, partial [Clostridium senegalense]
MIRPNKKPLKKIRNQLSILESSSDVTVYALDETSVSVESVNYYSWSTVGQPPILEKNGSHKGLRLVGSTSILNNMHTVVDIYSSQDSITSESIQSHMLHLMRINPGKKVIIFLDNAKTHNSIAMQKFYFDNRDRLEPIFLPKYSPKMNP